MPPSPPEFDVIVVGAGPSGTSTASELAKSGARVLLLERAKLPRYKTCGGAIPFNFFRTLSPRAQQTLEGTIEGGYYLGPNDRRFGPVRSVRIAGVMRDRFDYALAQDAMEAGAQLLEQTGVEKVIEESSKVVVQTNQGTFQSSFLVGADGMTGMVSRLFEDTRKTSRAAALEVEIPSDVSPPSPGFLIHFTQVRDGYAWVFPKGRLHSVGLASFNRDKTVVRKKLLDWLERMKYPTRGYAIHGHPIPLWEGKRKLQTKRILLVGDAAGTVDPLVGEGIRYGILSGRIAARNLLRAMDCDHIPPSYSQDIYREIQSDFVYAKLLAVLFYRFPGFCFDLGVRAPSATERLGKVLYGEMKFRDVFARGIRTLFRPAAYRRLFARESV